MQFEMFENPRSTAHIEHDSRNFDLPLAYHRLVPGYEPTPLLSLPRIAERLGVWNVFLKDESSRLGMPSFKMLGASWATAYAVRTHWLTDTAEVLSPIELGERIPERATKRLVAATDGNHGRGVARMAQMMGVACLIFVPKGTTTSRIEAIESEGATVEVVNGTYDDAILRSAQEADEHTLVVSDTSWEGYRDIPRQVTHGYSTLFREVDDALKNSGEPAPTLVLFQAGVGSFAAAGLIHFRGTTARVYPRTAIVEPVSANCLFHSAQEGEVTEVPGPHDSTMAGLNCGLPSQLTWPTVLHGTDVFLGIDDEAAHEAMRVLADNGVVAGESGAATLGGLLAVIESGSDVDREALGLTSDAVVLVINTEYATDPVNFAAVVGVSPEDVQATLEARRSAADVIRL